MRLKLVLSCISLLLCAGFTAAGARSYFIPTESFEWLPNELPSRSRFINIRSGGGSIGVAYSDFRILDPIPQTPSARRRQSKGGRAFRYRQIPFDPPNQLDYILFPNRWSGMGFIYQRGHEAGRTAHFDESNRALVRLRYTGTYLFVGVPYWLPVMTIGALPAWHLRRASRRTRRIERGLCSRCGYDLRVLTGGRCPECGTETPPPRISQSGAI